MKHNPFESIESAHEYVGLLRDAVNEAQSAINEDIESLGNNGARRLQALQLVTYKLSRLDQHLKSTRLIMNDLRSLRKLLLDERESVAARRDPVEHHLPHSVNQDSAHHPHGV